MEEICNASQAVIVTGAAIFAYNILLKGIIYEYGEIITYWKNKILERV